MTQTSTNQQISFVCNRLNILTVSQCKNVGYQEHMRMAIWNLCEFEVNENQKERYKIILTSFVDKGMRHCDFFRILYAIIYEWKAIDDACIEELLAWKADEGYDATSYSTELNSFIDIIITTEF